MSLASDFSLRREVSADAEFLVEHRWFQIEMVKESKLKLCLSMH